MLSEGFFGKSLLKFTPESNKHSAHPRIKRIEEVFRNSRPSGPAVAVHAAAVGEAIAEALSGPAPGASAEGLAESNDTVAATDRTIRIRFRSKFAQNSGNVARSQQKF